MPPNFEFDTEHKPVLIPWVPGFGAMLKHPSSILCSLPNPGGLPVKIPNRFPRPTGPGIGATFLVLQWLRILDPSWSHIFTLIFFPCPSIYLSHYLFDHVWSFLGPHSNSFLVELNFYFLSVNPHWPHPYGQSPCSSLADPFPFLRVLASWISNLAGSLAPFGLFKAGLMRNFPLENCWRSMAGTYRNHDILSNRSNR